MSAYGLEERLATVARLKTINGGRAWQGSLEDAYDVPRDASGRVAAHIIVKFGSPVKTARDRNMAGGEKDQPHVLPVDIACIAGTVGDADKLADAVFDLLLDWAPSEAADAFEAKGGYGTRRPATEATPTRHVAGLFFEGVLNNGAPSA